MRPKLNLLATTINVTFGEESTRPMIKGTPFLLWNVEVDCWCFGDVSYKDTGNLVKIDGKMNTVCYQKWLEENLHSSARKLCMGRTWIFQHDNDLKHKAKSTCHWLQQNKWWFWSGHLSLLTSILFSHSGEISSGQFIKDSPRIYRNWRPFAKKNGQFYHQRK